MDHQCCPAGAASDRSLGQPQLIPLASRARPAVGPVSAKTAATTRAVAGPAAAPSASQVTDPATSGCLPRRRAKKAPNYRHVNLESGGEWSTSWRQVTALPSAPRRPRDLQVMTSSWGRLDGGSSPPCLHRSRKGSTPEQRQKRRGPG